MDRRRKWTTEEVDLLITTYPYKTKQELMDVFPQYIWESIYSKAYALGLKRLNSYKNGKSRKKVIDLSEIDTEEKAYVLGFSAADGCVCERSGNRTPGFFIKLALSDKEHLECLRAIISPDSNIRVVKNPNNKKYVEFYVADKDLSNNLIKHGIVIRKTYSPKIPITVPERLIHHWIRGFFDGDGCIHIRKGTQRVVVSIVGYGTPSCSNSILVFIKDQFQNFCRKANVEVKRRHNLDQLTYTDKMAAVFLNWIYQDATIFMSRKYNLASAFIVPDISVLLNTEFHTIWSAKEDQYLLDNYSIKSLFDMSKELCRSQIGIQVRTYKLRNLGFIVGYKCLRWERPENEALEMHYPTSSWELLLSLFPGRTKGAIDTHARKLGLRRFFHLKKLTEEGNPKCL